jgi:hypothetical protein
MPENPANRRRHNPVVRAVIEIAFIIFLFYSNLLMGEFNRNSRHGKSFATALHDVVTPENLKIAVISAIAGYFVFEYLRKRS